MEHLEIKEGYKYTQSADVDITERVIAEQLYIPNGQSEIWKQITDAEADELEKQKEAQLKTANEDGTTSSEDNTVVIECPSCGRKIYYTPPVEETEAETAIMIDDEL